MTISTSPFQTNWKQSSRCVVILKCKTMPTWLSAGCLLLQHEFGNQPVGTHKRISAGKFVSKIENEEKARKFHHDLQPRRRLNSELSESILTPDSIHHYQQHQQQHHGHLHQQHQVHGKHLSITTIYAPAANKSHSEEQGSYLNQKRNTTRPVHTCLF